MTHPWLSDSPSTTIGARVRQGRLHDGLTEEALARALGCGVSHLQKAERGEVNFTAEEIVGLFQMRVRPSWSSRDLDNPIY